jgi:hypothetical protein
MTMTSVIYNSVFYDALTGKIDAGTDAFKAMLVTAAYVPNPTVESRRSDVTAFEVTGQGYVAGGAAALVAVTRDLANDRVNLALGAVEWASATIAGARGCIYYKSRGGAASADELLAYIDFGSDFASTNGPFTVGASTLRIRNNQ